MSYNHGTDKGPLCDLCGSRDKDRKHVEVMSAEGYAWRTVCSGCEQLILRGAASKQGRCFTPKVPRTQAVAAAQDSKAQNLPYSVSFADIEGESLWVVLIGWNGIQYSGRSRVSVDAAFAECFDHIARALRSARAEGDEAAPSLELPPDYGYRIS